MTGKEYAQRLRVVANFYEENPEFPLAPVKANTDELDIWFYVPERFHEAIKKIGGKKRISAGGIFIGVTKELADGVTIFLNIAREKICTQKVVGIRLEIKKVETVPAQFEQKEVGEEIVEWECPESFLEETLNDR